MPLVPGSTFQLQENLQIEVGVWHHILALTMHGNLALALKATSPAPASKRK